MKYLNKRIVYNSERKTIDFMGDVVVDLYDLQSHGKAKIFSKLSNDYNGFETILSIDDSNKPFDLSFISLGPEELITAIVEKRLSVDGVRVTDKIETAYSYLMMRSPG